MLGKLTRLALELMCEAKYSLFIWGPISCTLPLKSIKYSSFTWLILLVVSMAMSLAWGMGKNVLRLCVVIMKNMSHGAVVNTMLSPSSAVTPQTLAMSPFFFLTTYPAVKNMKRFKATQEELFLMAVVITFNLCYTKLMVVDMVVGLVGDLVVDTVVDLVDCEAAVVIINPNAILVGTKVHVMILMVVLLGNIHFCDQLLLELQP